ncbi:AMP-binding protein [Pseudonocardia xinjiangensis]|uniref:AMP-binding protein n=1 Tax=Pseudonocardia xinjiangensis TaxID=75289 RepID=UPI003D8E9FCF
MIIRSPYPDLDIPEIGLHEFLLGHLDPQDAERPATVAAAGGSGYTYGELVATVSAVAAGLGERGVARGDVAAILAPNIPEYPAVFHGVLAAGATVSPANALYTPRELAHQLRDSGARVLFAAPECLDRARVAVTHDGVRVDEVVVLGAGAGAGGPVRETPWEEFLETVHTGAGARPLVSPDDVAVLPYSSGTTGLSKGVQLTHRNLVANLVQAMPFGWSTPCSRHLAAIPISHIYGAAAAMNRVLQHRGLIVTMRRFELTAFLQAAAEHRIEHLSVVPPIMLALARSPLVDSYDLSSLNIVTSAAAPLDSNVARAVADRLHVTVLQGYGLTESSPAIISIPVDRPEIDRGSLGVLAPNITARVVDPETGEDVETGEPGELWARGPNIMRGYLNNAEATAATLDADGFLHTGDIVTVSEDGVFRVVDRLKELIKYKGNQVAPAELEGALLAHEGVADAAVVGVPGPDGGEWPKAFVVPQQGYAPCVAGGLAEEVMAFVAERVAPFKKVREVEFVDRIPRSSAGKILRRELRERESGTGA